eukprot:scaffold48060_cov64-Phaeocystis_antarctica.AAC.3
MPSAIRSCGVVWKKLENSQPPSAGSHSCTRITRMPAARAVRTCSVCRGAAGCSRVRRAGAGTRLTGQLASRRTEPRLLIEIEQEDALLGIWQNPDLDSTKSPRRPLDRRSSKRAQQARARTRVACRLAAEGLAGRLKAQVGVLLEYLLHKEARFVSGNEGLSPGCARWLAGRDEQHTSRRRRAPGLSAEMISTTEGKLSCCRVTSPGTYKSVPSVCRSGALPAEPRWTGFAVHRVPHEPPERARFRWLEWERAAPLQAAVATLPPMLPPTLLGSSHRQSLKAESRPSSCTRSAEAAAPSLSSAGDAAGAASWVEGEQEGLEAAAPSAPVSHFCAA